MASDIQHSIVEPCFRSGTAVVRLVWVNDHHVAPCAANSRPTVAEALHTTKRVTHGICVVAMWVVGVTCEEGLDPL